MRRPTLRRRLTACACTLAATCAAGVLLAPAASAAPARESLLPLENMHRSNANAPSRVCDVPPFGRKL